MTLDRRLRQAVRQAWQDPAAWPLGMLGFLVRGGIVVLALPILTLPSPVGIATLLGPAIISTGRLTGPLRDLVTVTTVVLVLVVAAALIIAAAVERAVHDWSAMPTRRSAIIRRLVAIQLIALVPLAAALAGTGGEIIEITRSELLLPGDLTVALAARVASRSVVPLATLVVGVVLCEAIDGLLARVALEPGRRRRTRLAAIGSVAATATTGWLVTLAVLVPGLAFLSWAWSAARQAWAANGSDLAQPMLAVLGVLLLVACWVVVLLACGIASLVRAQLWTSRVRVPGAGRGSDTMGHGI